MKTLSTLAAAALGWLVAALPASAAPGTIRMSVTPPGPISICETVTVAFAIAGYSDTIEADGYNFRILYDPARFAVVSGSASLHDTAGPTQNWLRFPPQENVTSPFLDDFTQFDPGVVHVSVADMRLAPDPFNPHGTAAATGFLYSFQLVATSVGPGGNSLQPAAGGVVLHDTFLAPGGVPLFDTASFNVTVVGPGLTIVRVPGPGNRVTITWPKGVLQSTDTLGALWTPVPGATNSITVPAAGARRFYRAVIP